MKLKVRMSLIDRPCLSWGPVAIGATYPRESTPLLAESGPSSTRRRRVDWPTLEVLGLGAWSWLTLQETHHVERIPLAFQNHVPPRRLDGRRRRARVSRQ